MTWEVATRGCVTFADGKTLTIAPEDWFDVVKWIYSHIDGPPKQDIEFSGAVPVTIIEVVRDSGSE